MKRYVVVEGRFDRLLVERMLDSLRIQDVEVVEAGGRSAVFAFARSVMRTRRRPVAVIAESDVPKGHGAADPFSDFDYLMKQAAGPVPYRFIRFDPALEVVFFQQPEIIERSIGRPLTEAEHWQAKIEPGTLLDELVPGGRRALLERLSGEDLKGLATGTDLHGLFDFLEKRADALSA